MKQLLYILSIIALATLSSCGGGSTFKISADIKGLGNQNVHVVFLGDSGVNDAFIPVENGKFKVQGNSTELTVVSILDSQNKPLFRLAVKGGDKLEVSGDYTKPHHYTCKGSDASEEWMKFEADHADLYDRPNAAPLDQAIEKYVHENKSSVVSTLLLVFDYSDPEKAQKLLAEIDEDAKPASLVDNAKQVLEQAGRPDTRLQTMLLCSMNGEFEALVPSEAKATILYWWSDNNQERRNDINGIKAIAADHADRIKVADITLNADSSAWRAVVRTDSTNWKHYWAPGGILDPAIERLRIRRVPLCIVTDSIGNQIYRGIDIHAAGKAIDTYLNK